MRHTTEVYFAIDHPATAGHFPGNPMVPGALLLDEVLKAVVESLDVGDVIACSAKFFQPVRPDQRLSVSWHDQLPKATRFECRLLPDGDLVAAGLIEIGAAKR